MKKILALCLVVVLAVTAVTGATLAYFTDKEQATNTMTIGNVEINIEEHVKAKDKEGEYTKYAPFVDDAFTLYPVSNETVYADLQPHFNKVVRTFNTSPSKDAAYIRTIVLFEKNNQLPANFANEGCEVNCDCCPAGLHFYYYNGTSTVVADGKTSHGSSAVFAVDENGEKLVYNHTNGKQYWVVVFTAIDEEAIPYGESLHTLNGVWMDKNVTSEQIAGWQVKDSEGKITDNKVDILVFSQGIQAYDLEHDEAMAALGEVDATLIGTLLGADEAAENDYTKN